MVHIERPHIGARQPGRSTIYSDALASTILERLALGESLRAICDTDATMPDRSTVVRWLQRNEAFRLRYGQARAVQADAWLDQFADTLRLEPSRDSTGRLDPIAVRHHRNQLGSMRWFADKLRSRPRPVKPQLPRASAADR